MSRQIPKETFQTIRKFLWKFDGGEVKLAKNVDTGIATVSLNHQEKRNAMSGRMMVNLRDCVSELENWKEGKAVILHGKGGNFCSGADLDFARVSGTAQEGHYMSLWMQDTLERLRQLPLVSVCLVEGPSLGGGAEMSVFCDFIVAADNVKYGFVQGKMGIITAWGGGTRLEKKVGYTKALDLFLSARILSARDCVDYGIAEIVVPASDGLIATETWLSKRLQLHHTVIRTFKKVVLKSNAAPYEDALEHELNAFSPMWGSEINREALAKRIKHIDNKL